MTQPPTTSQQAQEYIRSVLGSDREYWVIETRQGWVCQRKLTAEERANSQGLGLGCYVINKQTGVVTAHSSLHPRTIGRMFDEAIEAGNPVQGRQVYPPVWRVHLQANWEDSERIQYRVQAESLILPPRPPIDHTLTIDKNSHRYHTNQRATHVTCTRAANRAVNAGRNGAWPQAMTFEF